MEAAVAVARLRAVERPAAEPCNREAAALRRAGSPERVAPIPVPVQKAVSPAVVARTMAVAPLVAIAQLHSAYSQESRFSV